MKCEKCKYCQYDWGDDMYLCRFGWEDEDSKGNCGCRYNQKTLDKKNKTLQKEEQDAANEFYEDFVKFCRKEENNEKYI